MRGIAKRLLMPALMALWLNGMGCDSGPEEAAPYLLEAGLWESEEARLEITDLGGTITFLCAAGTLDEAIQVRQDGEFDVRGTMMAGPLAGLVRPVRYEGRIVGNRLTLSIDYTDTPEAFGVFELTKGFDSNVAYICVC